MNGIESDVNSISITLDGQGNTINYSRNQVNEEFPSSTPKLNEASIRKLFEDQFQVSLAYVPDHLYNNAKGNYFLGYIPNDQSANSMDANTGKFISFSGKKVSLPRLRTARFRCPKRSSSQSRLHSLAEIQRPDGWNHRSNSRPA